MKIGLLACIYFLSCANLVLAQESFDTEIKRQWDIFYTPAKDSMQSVDVYWNDASENANVILFVHGGGWLSGDKKEYRDMAADLARLGMTVILLNYRLSPKVKFPAHVEDVAAAIAWAHTSLKKYNGDPEKIFLMGHSAGCHLITLAVCDKQYLEKYGLNQNNINGLITISGVFEIKTQEGGATKNYLGMVFGDDEKVWGDATCQSHINKSKNDLPPFLVTWGEKEDDLLKNESLNIISAFKSAGVMYQTFVFEGSDHNAFVTALQDKENSFSKKLMEFIVDPKQQN